MPTVKLSHGASPKLPLPSQHCTLGSQVMSQSFLLKRWSEKEPETSAPQSAHGEPRTLLTSQSWSRALAQVWNSHGLLWIGLWVSCQKPSQNAVRVSRACLTACCSWGLTLCGMQLLSSTQNMGICKLGSFCLSQV